MQDTETDGIGEVAGELSVDVVRALEVGKDSKARGGAGERETDHSGRGAECEDAVEEDRIGEEPVNEDVFVRCDCERVRALFEKVEGGHLGHLEGICVEDCCEMRV